MGLHESFKDADDRDDTNDSSIGTPGDLTDGRATLVPPSGFTHLQVMKDLHKCVVTNKSGPESPRFRGKIPVQLVSSLTWLHLPCVVTWM